MKYQGLFLKECGRIGIRFIMPKISTVGNAQKGLLAVSPRILVKASRRKLYLA
jgi:hypothetical protein